MENAEIVLDGERAHYLRTVLRLRVGNEIVVFNGRGGEFEAKVLSIERRKVRLRLASWCDRDAESRLGIHLGLAIPKGERMDWAVQKAVELGVAGIFPLLAEHGNVLLKGERAERKRQHWQAIVVSACEQCGRNRVPVVALPQALASWVEQQAGGIVLDPSGVGFAELDPPERELRLLIGPEGGLSPGEIQLARAKGFRAACLGPRILRVETAVVAGLAVTQNLWGDLH